MNHQSSSRATASRMKSLWEACYAPPPRARRAGSERSLYDLIAALAILGLLFVVLNAKPALAQGVQLIKVDVSVVGKGYRASKLIGSSVTNDKNENIGKLDDIIIDTNRVMFAVIEVGGFLGLGGRLVAVPYESLKVSAGNKVQLPGATKEELQKLTEFKYLS
jgi:sporulation protein YlmC with PRC-barrel domain